jgi:ferrous iron transport protein B
MSRPAGTRAVTIAIAGNPNCGKSTLFNQLTGLRQKVANYPGITVEKKSGTFSHEGADIELIDLPGTYSLSPRSEDARVAAQALLGDSPLVPPFDGVLCVLDGNTLERSLPLVLQVRALGFPMIVLVNMADELKRIGMEIDLKALEKRLGVPVLSISARTRQGLSDVKEWLVRRACEAGAADARGKAPSGLPATSTQDLRAESKSIAQAVVRNLRSIHGFSAKIDKFVMHKVAGPVIFLAVVLLVFQAIFSWTKPFMDLIDGAFTAAGAWAGGFVSNPFLHSLLKDGIIAGIGGVVVFLPQILIVFFFISVLENSGYLARAAIVMDRFFGAIGLQGKSFLPFISSYACAIPGIMAARTIENKRERLATIFVAPFMTCSARLPVYALLIGAFVPNVPVVKGVIGLRAVALLGLYAAGFAAAVFTAWGLNSVMLKADKTPFHLEVPPYRWPSVKATLFLMWDRSTIFLKNAGTVILAVNVLLWFLASFPKSTGPEPLRDSYAGKIGVFIEPAIKPLGLNWKVGVGLVGSQAAREVMVSSLSTIYSIEDENDTESLQAALHRDITPLAAVALLVFFALAMQCMSTTAVVMRETGGWKVPVIQFFYMNALAYAAALLVFQGGRLLGFR